MQKEASSAGMEMKSSAQPGNESLSLESLSALSQKCQQLDGELRQRQQQPDDDAERYKNKLSRLQ